jgi:hypothetical protein
MVARSRSQMRMTVSSSPSVANMSDLGWNDRPATLKEEDSFRIATVSQTSAFQSRIVPSQDFEARR